MNEEKKTTYMTLCQINGKWQVVTSYNQQEREDLLKKHPEAVPIRFNVGTIGGNSPHYILEEAQVAAERAGVKVSLMQPEKELSSEATMVYYTAVTK